MQNFISNFQNFDKIFEQVREEQLVGGRADGKSLQDIADHHNVSLSEIEDQYNMGLKVEREHTNDETLADEIVKDHLWEFADYYTRLKEVEKPKPKRKSKLTYDEKDMRSKGLHSWRGPNPTNK